VEALGKSPGAGASGLLAHRFGYAPVFALGVVLAVAFLPLLSRATIRDAR
jgi:hypothetical protein